MLKHLAQRAKPFGLIPPAPQGFALLALGFQPWVLDITDRQAQYSVCSAADLHAEIERDDQKSSLQFCQEFLRTCYIAWYIQTTCPIQRFFCILNSFLCVTQSKFNNR